MRLNLRIPLTEKIVSVLSTKMALHTNTTKKTDELAIVTKKGYVVTYFKPSNGYKYYIKQKNEKRKKKHDY